MIKEKVQSIAEDTFYSYANKCRKELTDEDQLEKIDMTDIFLKELELRIKEGEIIIININALMRKGKMLIENSKILMANGEWKKIQEVQIGDKIISPNKEGTSSEIQTIKNKIKHEKVNICEIRKTKDNSLLYTCCEEHQIPVKTTWQRKCRTTKEEWYEYKHETYNAGDLADKNKEWFKAKCVKTITAPIIDRFACEDPEEDPYIVGLYLGDGWKDRNYICIETSGKETEEYLKRNKHYRYTLNRNDRKSNRIVLSKGLGLHDIETGSYNKRIPDRFLNSSFDYRIKIFEGLIDSDMYVEKSGTMIYTTASNNLANDIIKLCKTLGCRTSKREIWKNCQSFTEKRKYYSVNIIAGAIKHLINNKRKERYERIQNLDTENIRNRESQYENIIVKRIPQKMDGYCIEVEGESKLYITDNYTVTHNSTLAMAIGEIIFNMLKEYGYREKDEVFGLKNIARDHQENSKLMRDPKTQFTVIVTDESNELENTGENSTKERALEKVFSDVQAGRYVHRICCSPKETVDPNADILLSVTAMDKRTTTTHAKLFYKYYEGGEENIQLLGYIRINVGNVIGTWVDESKNIFYRIKRGTATEADKKRLEKLAREDYYTAYYIKKHEKMELITNEGIFEPRKLEYAEQILKVIEDLRKLTKLSNIITRPVVRNYIKAEFRKSKIPLSIVGESLATDEAIGVLEIWKAYHKSNKDLQALEHKKTADRISEEEYQEQKEQLEEIRDKLLISATQQEDELKHYKEINTKYQTHQDKIMI